MLRLFAIFVFFLGVASVAKAEGRCLSIRLDSPGQPLADRDVWNQGSDTSCYVYAALTLFASQRDGQRQSRLDSPELFYLNILGAPSDQRERFLDPTFGRTLQAFQEIYNRPYCPRGEVLRAIPGLANEAGVSSVENFLATFGAIHEANKNDETTAAFSGLSINQELLQALWPRFREHESASLLLGLLNHACHPQEQSNSLPALPRVRNFGFRAAPRENTLVSAEEFIDRLHDNLDQQKAVGVEYCSDVLMYNSVRAIRQREFRSDLRYLAESDFNENFNFGCGFHASVVIGRRETQRGCEFLLQNSWGVDCDGYDEGSECEAGKIWLKDTDLAPNLFRLVEVNP